MNFNLILFFLVLVFIVACGVKGDPNTPKKPAFPSLLENYPDIDADKKLNETKKSR